MKKLSVLSLSFAVMFFLSACNKDESPEATIAGEWVIAEIGSTWTNEVITGEAIGYKESYLFKQNGTFVKTRAGSRSDGQATGTFTFKEAPSNEMNIKYYLLLTFETGTGLIISCYSSAGIEEFSLFEDGRLLNGAGACDNAILTYRKRN